MSSNDDLIYQINTHLLYELKWLIFAAAKFNQGDNDAYVALIDSATIHARNLIEFATLGSAKNFTLVALGGTAQKNAKTEKWSQFLNNRVTHMYGREAFRPPWPDGLDNERCDRFIVLATFVIQTLKAGGNSIPNTKVKVVYNQLVDAANTYLSDPTEDNMAAIDKLYDDSKDSRPY